MPSDQSASLSDDMTADLAAVQPMLTQIAELDAQITGLRNKRDVIYDRLWDKTRRAQRHQGPVRR